MWQKSNALFVSNLNIIPRILGVTSGLSAQRQSPHKHNTGTHERREEKNPHSVLSTSARYDDGRKNMHVARTHIEEESVLNQKTVSRCGS